MIIAGEYSFNDGAKYIQQHHAARLQEVRDIIAAVDASVLKRKASKEKTKKNRVLYSPPAMNKAFKEEFNARGWSNQSVQCDYPATYYTQNYTPPGPLRGFRDMDFLKGGLGIEVQFGKYAFAVYNVCAKMTIFKKLGYIDAGIEIVPVKTLVREMSTGIIYFEQFLWDLEQRGVSNIDIPVLILGIADTPTPPQLPLEELVDKIDPTSMEAVDNGDDSE